MKNRTGYGWFAIIVGFLSILLGILTFVNPMRSMNLIVILCGILAIASGVSDIISYVKAQDYTDYAPMISLVAAVFGIMAGAMLLAYPTVGTITLTVLIPIWFIAHCISRLARLSDIRAKAGEFHYWFTMIVNILGLVMAILMLIRPYVGIFTIRFIIGMYLILNGIDAVIMGVSKLGEE